MVITHHSVSHLWGLTRHKLLPGRYSSLSHRGTVRSVESRTTQATTRNEHADGFYMYSQEQQEEEAREHQRGQARSSDSSQMTYLSARSVPEGRPSLPYTVSSLEWNIFSDPVKALDETLDDVTVWRDSVRCVFTRVYAVARIVLVILLHYGVDVEDLPDGILAHVHHAENLTTSSSIVSLIDATENLYYTLYARLVVEMANVDLCAGFGLDARYLVSTEKKRFTLPEPAHLLKILVCCRAILDAPAVCRSVNVPIIRQYQAEYIRRALTRFPSGGLCTDNLLGYRAHTLSMLAGRNSFHERWRRDAWYEMPPAELLTTLSERYLAFLPNAAAVTPKTTVDAGMSAVVSPLVVGTEAETRIGTRDECELIQDHRQATLARLEGRSIGEVRREDGGRRLSEYARLGQCVCRSMCVCASDCTAEPERACPCAERVLGLERRGTGALGIGERCSRVAKAVFEAVASIRRDVDGFEIAVELDRGVGVFGEVLWG